MLYGVLIFIAIVAVMLDSDVGKLILASAVIAVGLFIVKLITGIALFATIAKWCAVITIVIAFGAIVYAIFGN